MKFFNFLIFATFLLHFCIASYGGEEDEEYAEEQARDEIFHQEEPAEGDDYVPPTPRYGGSRPRANAPPANDAESIKANYLRGKLNDPDGSASAERASTMDSEDIKQNYLQQKFNGNDDGAQEEPVQNAESIQQNYLRQKLQGNRE